MKKYIDQRFVIDDVFNHSHSSPNYTSYDIVIEDGDGDSFKHIAECGCEEDAKYIVKALKGYYGRKKGE